MHISRHIHLSLYGAAMFGLAACSDSDTPLAPESESGAEQAVSPALLPGRIVFQSSRNGQGNRIYAMNADGSGVVELTSSHGVAPAWSYDNQKIAFMTDRPAGINKVVVDIFVIDANGANGHWASPTPSPLNIAHPRWSPDGTRILVWSQPNKMMSLDVATGALTTLKVGGVDVQGRYPSFDQTGQKIVFAAGSALGVMNADGTGGITTIAGPSGGTIEHPRFSPDGQKILFSAVMTGSRNGDLYVASQGSLTLLGDHNLGHRASWAPDGKHIAYERLGRIYQMNADGSRRTRLSAPEMYDEAPDYTH
jgi:Tol biopolymer transport system component